MADSAGWLTWAILGSSACCSRSARWCGITRCARCSWRPSAWRWPRFRKDLPAIMTITLALGVQRMARRQRHHPPAAGGRDAGLGHDHLFRQDRHPDQERNDRARASSPADACSRSPAAATSRRAAFALDGAEIDPAQHATLSLELAGPRCCATTPACASRRRDMAASSATRPKARCWRWR